VDAHGEGSRREELAALRIDRDAPGARPRRRSRGPVLAAGVAALLVLGSLLAWRLTLGRSLEVRVAYATRSAGGAGGAARAPLLRGSGYVVTGERYVSLGVRVPGRIEAYLVEEGDSVSAGDPLVRLDERPYRAALEEAQAALRLARANLELRRRELHRLRELHARDVASDADLDVKENEVKVGNAEVARLQARVTQLQIDLDDTVLRATADGVVLEKFKEVGEIAVPGGFAGSGELIRLANLSELRAELDVNESDLAKVRLGQPAEVVPDAFPAQHYAARVVKLYPQINRQKGTLKVEVRILEPDERLRPDMSVRVSFFEEEAPADAAAPAAAAVLAPRDALRSDAGGAFVWVVTGGRLRRQEVTVGADAGDPVAIAAGLAGGEALVVGELEGARDGLAVEVASEGAP
jgi:RND family efflux transporter MFP subunit